MRFQWRFTGPTSFGRSLVPKATATRVFFQAEPNFKRPA